MMERGNWMKGEMERLVKHFEEREKRV